MNAEGAIAIWLICAVVGVLVLFLVIRYAVQLGVAAALRTHEMWMHDGSRDTDLARHAAKAAEREKLREADRQQLS